MANDDDINLRLRAAVHYTTGRMCLDIGRNQGKEFSPQAIAAIAETTFRQCDVFAKDLEAFARHAKRSTVTSDDVKLLARRSTALAKFIQKKNDLLLKEPKHLRKSTGKDNKDQDSNAAPDL
ncbi:centromere protein S [Gadus morhua]|uniref:centromere protein S n=1 Tax=Gadus morhua TaxID=8049 RepID=UPI0011B357E9|nr:centromere protein S-like [Gadus morhua]